MMGVVKNIMAAWPITYAVIASNSSHCHPANGILYTNILPSHAICPSLCKCGFVTRKIVSKIECVYQFIHHHLCGATPLDWISVMTFKITKIDSEGFLGLSMKISTSENTVLVTIWGVTLLLYFYSNRSCTPISSHPQIVAAHGAL